MTDYKHPEVLVSTEWVAAHIDDPNIRLVEVDVDTSAYEKGHLKKATGWNYSISLSSAFHPQPLLKKERDCLELQLLK